MNEHQYIWSSPLGKIYLAANDEALTGLWFHDQKYVPVEFNATRGASDRTVIKHSIDWLVKYFEGSADAPADLPLVSPQGTDFQQSVWKALLKVKPGQVITYGQLATRLKKPKAVRAVAAAVGRNPISIIIPCHRIIGANGSLTGYAGGLVRKESLLRLENENLRSMESV